MLHPIAYFPNAPNSQSWVKPSPRAKNSDWAPEGQRFKHLIHCLSPRVSILKADRGRQSRIHGSCFTQHTTPDPNMASSDIDGSSSLAIRQLYVIPNS